MANWQHYTPVIEQNPDGTLTLRWPDSEPDTAIIHRQVLVDFVNDINHLKKQLSETHHG